MNTEQAVLLHYFYEAVLSKMNELGLDFNELFEIGEDDFLQEITPFGLAIDTLSSDKTALEIWELMPRIAEAFWGLVISQQALEKGKLPELSLFNHFISKLLLEDNIGVVYMAMGFIGNETVSYEDRHIQTFRAHSQKQAEEKFVAYLKGTDKFREEVARRQQMNSDDGPEPAVHIDFCRVYHEGMSPAAMLL